MSNFTITRVTNSTDQYGCTNFETNQESGEMASLVANEPLDGSIEWHLDAATGYTVNIDDFDISGTVPTSVGGTPGVIKRLQDDGSGMIAPVLGIVLEQVTTQRILITLYLHPDIGHGIPGTVFQMPLNDVSNNIFVRGCAVPDTTHIRVSMLRAPGGNSGEVEETSTINENYEGDIVIDEGSNGEVIITGGIEPITDGEAELFTYTINASSGERFLVPPNFSLSTNDYRTSSSTIEDNDGNITGATIKVFKKA